MATSTGVTGSSSDSSAMSSFPAPTLGHAIRITGFVATSNSGTSASSSSLPDHVLGTIKRRSLRSSFTAPPVPPELAANKKNDASTTATADAAAKTTTTEETAPTPTPPPPPSPFRTSLDRQQSVAGNILILTHDTTNDDSMEEEGAEAQGEKNGKTAVHAFLLQRKLQQTPTSAIRVGYPLELMLGASEQDEDDEDDGKTTKTPPPSDQHERMMKSNQFWQVPQRSKLVAIHIHHHSNAAATAAATDNESGQAGAKSVDNNNMNQMARLVHGNPQAEWYLWQHAQSPHILGAMGVFVAASSVATTAATTTSTTPMTTYYSVTPLYQESLWDDLCTRQQEQLEQQQQQPKQQQQQQTQGESHQQQQQERHGAYSEEEARHVFVQLLKCLQRLRELNVCHRNITLDNLLLVDDDGEDDDKSSSEQPAQSAATLRQNQAQRRRPRRLCLARHGFALRLDSKDAAKGTKWRIPPPATAQPLYVAPEWLQAPPPPPSAATKDDDNDDVDMSATTTSSEQQLPINPVDPFAIDLWSATICLLVLLVGASQVERVLYAAPVPQDPRFAAVTQHTATYFAQRGQQHEEYSYMKAWSPALMELLQGLLQPDPAQRWTLSRVLQHEWVKKMTGTTSTPTTTTSNSTDQQGTAAATENNKRQRLHNKQ